MPSSQYYERLRNGGTREVKKRIVPLKLAARNLPKLRSVVLSNQELDFRKIFSPKLRYSLYAGHKLFMARGFAFVLLFLFLRLGSELMKGIFGGQCYSSVLFFRIFNHVCASHHEPRKPAVVHPSIVKQLAVLSRAKSKKEPTSSLRQLANQLLRDQQPGFDRSRLFISMT